MTKFKFQMGKNSQGILEQEQQDEKLCSIKHQDLHDAKIIKIACYCTRIDKTEQWNRRESSACTLKPLIFICKQGNAH